MFTELTEELLDLQVTVRGYGNAMYASSEDAPGCCGIALCCSVLLCCHLCW